LTQLEVESFHFEPSKLKKILDWNQQEMMVENFKEAALLALGHDPRGSPENRPIEKVVLINHPILFRILTNGGATVNTSVVLELGCISTCFSCQRLDLERRGLAIPSQSIYSELECHLSRYQMEHRRRSS